MIDTHELGRRPGAMVPVSRDVPAPADLGNDLLGVPEGSVLELDLQLESVMEGVYVTGRVHAGAVGQCGRCLIEIEQDVDVDLQELYAYPDKRPEGVEDDDLLELDGDLLDLEPAVRDALVPALPFQPVCRDDCPGLCSECGARLADEPGHHHDVVDPRWSALHGLTLDRGEADEDRREPAGSRTDAQEEN